MKWLSKKMTKRSDEKIDETTQTAKQAKESYDRMLRSLKDLEDILRDDTSSHSGPDSQRG